jgi:HD-GYP domain-containing protein (c-di-GMP phosphodiesterase class II)
VALAVASVTSDSNVGLSSMLRLRGAPLLEALAQHSPATAIHAEASSSYAFSLAVELGFDRHRSEAARDLARLHEVGKLYVPASVLAKPEPERTPAELLALEDHPEAGARIARGAGIQEEACTWLLHQRERFDGSGPLGLAGDQIPVESRLLRVVCACHLTMAQPSRSRAADRAILRIGAGAGDELDPEIAAAMIAIIERVDD